MPSLVVTEGPLTGQQLEVDPQLVLGRGDADLVIDDPEISRRHAMIRSQNDTFEIDDLDSLNGTWVNGQRIQKTARLMPGDVIRLGKTVIAVEQSVSAVAPAPSTDTMAGPMEVPPWEYAAAMSAEAPAEVAEAEAQIEVETGRCPQCNAEVPSQARFCLYCGAALGSEQAAAPAPAPAPPPPAPDPVPILLPEPEPEPAAEPEPEPEPELPPAAAPEPPAAEPEPEPQPEREPPAQPSFVPGLEPPVAAEPEPEAEPVAAAEPEEAASSVPFAPPIVPRADDELRPVTALFADVVGSTSLGERLAPDEVKALIGEWVNRMARAVEQFGGTIQAYQGDGIAAFFGMPTAHEDDPERAAHAALRILDEVKDYARDIATAWGATDFNVRLGINTGQMAVGIVGSDEQQQQVALGDTTNVAARLQSVTAPGTIAVGESTATRLAHRFVLESLGDFTVKGRVQPVAAWRLVRVQSGTRAPAPTPLVGREAEVTRLRAAVDEVTAGRGQLLLLVGEGGIGKTRLLSELRTIAEDRALWLEGQCHSYGGGELLHWPFIEILRGWLGVEDGEAGVSVRTKLRAKLAALPALGSNEVMPQLGRLLSVPADSSGDTLQGLTPEQLEEDIQRAYRNWLEALSAQTPVILAIDDLHWADLSTLQLARELLESLDRAPILIVAAFRADVPSPGARFRLHALELSPHRVVELPVGPLSDEAAQELVRMLMPEGLDPVSQEHLVKRAEGNPLYLEELLRSLIEGGGLERRQRTWALTVTPASLVPPALEGLLIARIDHLPEGSRRLAELAAVIGRTFPARALERAAASEEYEQDLSTLLRAQFIREHRRYPELEYTFKHGLLQEAALSKLTPARREELYTRVAAVFEELYSSLDDRLEVLAYYYARGDNPRKALEYLEKAAERAASLNANAQAVELCRRALKVADKLDDAAARQRLEERIYALT